jgi:hypothetical protein
MPSFTFGETHLRTLFSRARLPLDEGAMTLFGLRGCSPANATGGGPASSHRLTAQPVDYVHPRCTIGYFLPGGGIAVYPGSTVPYGASVRARIGSGGEGVNQLCVGLHPGYTKGFHKQSSPERRHRALRMERRLPIQRTGDDADFDADDNVEFEAPYDNLHCAWTPSVDTPKYSSLGCQVVVGFPRPTETGPWKELVGAIYAVGQDVFSYALFRGNEALFTATAPSTGGLPLVLRYGSVDAGGDDIVERVQEELRSLGLLTAAADGQFGFKTLSAVLAFQRSRLGRAAADGIVGPQTGAALGIDPWPTT